MAYSIRSNSFVSHLTQREYTFTDRDSRRAAMEKMLREDAEVRETSQTRAKDAGVKRPLSDREIREGSFMPDRRTTVERVADEVAARGAKHDPYAVAIETIRGKQRLTDPPDDLRSNPQPGRKRSHERDHWRDPPSRPAPAGVESGHERVRCRRIR